MKSSNTTAFSTDFAGAVSPTSTNRKGLDKHRISSAMNASRGIQFQEPDNDTEDNNGAINKHEFKRLLNNRDTQLKQEIGRQQQEIKKLREEISFLISRSPDVNSDKNNIPQGSNSDFSMATSEHGDNTSAKAPQHPNSPNPQTSKFALGRPPLNRNNSINSLGMGSLGMGSSHHPGRGGYVYEDFYGPEHKPQNDNDDDDEDEGIEMPLLPEDTFSYLAFSKWNSTSMLTALAVVAVQITTLSVLALDFAATNYPGNTLGVPVGVNTRTATIQVVALFIIVFSQGDLQDSLNLLFMGYDKEELEKNLHTPISYPRWLISLSTRLFVTFMGLAITFVMIVRESDVTQLLLDFTSIEFVTNIDNIFFWLTAWGYLGLSAQRDATLVVQAKAPVLVQEEAEDDPHPSARRRNRAERDTLERVESSRTKRRNRHLHVKKKSKAKTEENPHAAIEGHYRQSHAALEGHFNPQGSFNPHGSLDTLDLDQPVPERSEYTERDGEDDDDKYSVRSAGTMLTAQRDLLKFGQEHRSRCYSRFPRFLFISTIYFILLTGWAIIYYWQRTGTFVCDTIFVQLNDIYHPGLATFSGLYDFRCGEGGRKVCNRAVYVENGHGSYSETARFYFCEDIEAWVFGFDEGGHFDCDSWIIRSPDQDVMAEASYNILESVKGSEPWTIKVGDRRQLPMPEFTLQCYDCQYDELFCGGEGRGHCENNRCVCEEGWYGYRCDYQLPCLRMEVNPLHNIEGSRTWAGTYQKILAPTGNNGDGDDGRKSEKLLTKYNRPAYIGGGRVEGRGAVPVEVIFYNGRRWINVVLDATVTYEEVQQFLVGAHGYWSNYTTSFMTGAVDVNTPEDSADPSRLDWLEANPPGADRGRVQGPNLQNNRIDMRLICSSCSNETNPCLYGGICNADAECECKQGNSKIAGRLCQIPPSGNGFCDVTFNTPQFNFDGGDCCENTCVSSADNECGVVPQSTISGSTLVYIGFPNCTDPDAVKQISGSQTLYNVLERGRVICGTYASDFMTDFFAAQCQAIAAALLGDKEAFSMDIWGTAVGVNRFTAINDGKYDIIFGSDFLANRDIYERISESPFSFATMPYYFAGLTFAGIPEFVQCADNYDYISAACQGIRICVDATSSWYGVVSSYFPRQSVIGTEGIGSSVPALGDGLCNVFGATGFEVVRENVERLGYNMSLGYAVGNRIHSKSFETWMTRSADRQWTKMTSWIFEALVQAEELSISQESAGLMKATPVFNDGDYKFDDIFQRAVAANGNFGEIWDKTMPFPRPPMNHVCNGTSGLILSMGFGAYQDLGSRPTEGGHIERILRRGALVCAVSPDNAGFAKFNEQTNNWVGFDVDICRAVAAAIFNGPPKVDFVAEASSEVFNGIKSGTIDVATGRTRTLDREIKHGSSGGFAFDFCPPYFYDGMVFAGYEPHGRCASDLSFDGSCADTLICVAQGTTWHDAVISIGVPDENIMLTTSSAESLEKHFARECNAIVYESYRLDPALKSMEDYFVGTERHTKEPLSLMHRSDDQQFSDLIRWIVYGLFNAEERGVTKETFVDMPTTNLFGSELTGIWQNSVRESGNFFEIFSRNLDGLVVREGLNLLNRLDGPQLCASPGTAPYQ